MAPKKRRVLFLEKEPKFLSEVDRVFDVFCNNNEQRRLEKDHKLRMTEDYVFYENKRWRIEVFKYSFACDFI